MSLAGCLDNSFWCTSLLHTHKNQYERRCQQIRIVAVHRIYLEAMPASVEGSLISEISRPYNPTSCNSARCSTRPLYCASKQPFNAYSNYCSTDEGQTPIGILDPPRMTPKKCNCALRKAAGSTSLALIKKDCSPEFLLAS